MKIKLSPLQIENISMISCFVHFHDKSNSEPSADDLIDLDFTILDHKSFNGKFKIILQLEVNRIEEITHTCYSIIATMEGVFKYHTFKNENEESSVKLNAALPMMISNLRSTITDITAKYPLGKFVIPSIDLQQLIKDKSKSKKVKK